MCLFVTHEASNGLGGFRFDMHVHTTTTADQDLAKTWCDMRREISLVDDDGENAPGQSSFGHIVG